MIHKTCHLFQYIGIHTSEILQFSDLHNRIQGAQFTPPFYIGFFIHPRWWYSQLIFHHISPLSTSSAVKKPCHCASRRQKHLQKQTPHWHQKVVPARYCYHLTLRGWVSEQDQRRRNLPFLVKTNQFSTVVLVVLLLPAIFFRREKMRKNKNVEMYFFSKWFQQTWSSKNDI